MRKDRKRVSYKCSCKAREWDGMWVAKLKTSQGRHYPALGPGHKGLPEGQAIGKLRVERWDLRELGHAHGFLHGPCSVQSRSFQARAATALFLRPKNMGAWELVKHKNDRHVPGKVKSPLLALSEESGREINQLAVSGRPPLGLDLRVRQDTSRPGSAGHDGPCKKRLRL